MEDVHFGTWFYNLWNSDPLSALVSFLGDTSYCGSNRGITLRATAQEDGCRNGVSSQFSGRISVGSDKTALVLIRFIHSELLFTTLLIGETQYRWSN